ncbi:MAG: Co2+/Mg2+ efflux protein ApaG [Chitinophagales bacterium]|nr:Co2+/Mg2+ efflux protein ApaG [Chitinophagales bacterium]
MVQQVTEGVSITVETFYQPEQSNPLNSEFLHAYRITIENLSSNPVQLLSRHWYISDTFFGTDVREVEGEGVVGEQPIIQPGESYQYISAANLRSDIGKMYGTYEMENLFNKSKFTVSIPEFPLVAPFKMN